MYNNRVYTSVLLGVLRTELASHSKILALSMLGLTLKTLVDLHTCSHGLWALASRAFTLYSIGVNALANHGAELMIMSIGEKLGSRS